MQKRISYVKTPNGLEEQRFASAADIVSVKRVEGKITAETVQQALEELADIAATGGVTGVKGDNETEYRQGQVNITKENIGLGNVTNDAQVKRSEMGKADGVATLGSDGKVPSSQLPSYVDDVVEYDNLSSLPQDGIAGVIYVTKNDNKTYRWSGTGYTEISQSLALGETTSTAYPGDKGAKNASNIADLTDRVEDNEDAIKNITNGTTEVGSATKAGKLATPRTITIAGDATGEITFDGSENKEMTVALANSGVAQGTYSVVSVDAKGRVTNGAQMIEWGVSGQGSPSTNLANGGIFFKLIE